MLVALGLISQATATKACVIFFIGSAWFCVASLASIIAYEAISGRHVSTIFNKS